MSGCGLDLDQGDQMAGSCERGNEPSGYVKGGEYLDHLNDQ